MARKNKIVSTRQTLGRIKAKHGREAAQAWADQRGLAVSWQRGSLTVNER